MNIDNGEGCLNAMWYETGAVVEDCDGIWRVNVLLGGKYVTGSVEKFHTWRMSKTMTEQNIFTYFFAALCIGILDVYVSKVMLTVDARIKYKGMFCLVSEEYIRYSCNFLDKLRLFCI